MRQSMSLGAVNSSPRGSGSKTKIICEACNKEYSSNASIHGVGYIFNAANAIEKTIWYFMYSFL